MEKLPSNLNYATLSSLLINHGQWLVERQPKRGLDDFETISQTFTQLSGHVQHQLQQELTALWPDIPFSRAEFDPERQIKTELPIYWICDAIDGGVQYLSGLPLWTMTLCLVEDGKPVLSLVHYPTGNCTYYAQAGQGAYCNNERLRVATRNQLELAMIGTSFPNYPQRTQTEIDDFIHRLKQTIPKVLAQRWMGPASLTLSQLAAGMLDGYWETGRSLVDWLPGALIAQEAGARLSGLDGGTFDWGCQGILVASTAMYPLLANVLINSVEIAK